jgi:peptidoglycan hydrolase-like protein with peptidoglycan-binding domain
MFIPFAAVIVALGAFAGGYQYTKNQINNERDMSILENQQDEKFQENLNTAALRMFTELYSLQNKGEDGFVRYSPLSFNEFREDLQSFQQEHNLAPDGQADLETLQALRQEINELEEIQTTLVETENNPTTQTNDSPFLESVNNGYLLSTGSSGSDLVSLQNKLHALGLYNGKAHGQFDAATEKAIREFQRTRQLAVDGIVGPLTRERLLQAA